MTDDTRKELLEIIKREMAEIEEQMNRAYSNLRVSMPHISRTLETEDRRDALYAVEALTGETASIRSLHAMQSLMARILLKTEIR